MRHRNDLVRIIEVPDLEDVLVDPPYAFNQLPAPKGYVLPQVDPVFCRKYEHVSGFGYHALLQPSLYEN